jgi:hypothetical protein
MQSSSSPMQAGTPVIELTLDKIELFYETVSHLACNSTDIFHQLAKHILTKYLHYLNCTAAQVRLTNTEKASLQIHLTRFGNLLADTTPLGKSIFADIQADFTAEGKYVAALFSEPGDFASFVNFLNDIHTKNLQSQPTSLSPVLQPRAAEIAHKVYVFVSHTQTLDLIIHEGNDYFYMDRFEEALSVFLKGKFIIEAQLEHHTPNINEYAETILKKTAVCYLNIGKTNFNSNVDLAAEYWKLATEESETLGSQSKDTWLDAQLNLAMYENDKAILTIKTDTELGTHYFNTALERIQIIFRKFPGISGEFTRVSDCVKCNIIEVLRCQFLNNISYAEKFRIAHEILALAKNLAHKPATEPSLAIALLMQQNISLILLELLQIAIHDNLALTDKLHLTNQALNENNKTSLDVNSAQQRFYQTSFNFIIMTQIIKLAPVLTSLQITSLWNSIKQLINRLPAPLREPSCDVVFKELIKAFSIQLNAHAQNLSAALPLNYTAMIEIQNHYTSILEMHNHKYDLFSAHEKTTWYQLFLLYALRATLNHESEPIEVKIKYIKKMFRDYEPLVIAPEPVILDFMFLQRQLAAFMYDFAHTTTKPEDLITFLNLSNAIIYKIPFLAWSDIDTLNINTSEKIIQTTKAETIYPKKITAKNADPLHDDIISLINEMDVIKIASLKDLNAGWLILLEQKRDRIIQFYYQQLDKLIDKLGSKLLSRTYFFDFQFQQRPDIIELRQLYYDTLKPLKFNKCSDNLSDADFFILEYFRYHGKGREPLINNIQSLLDTLSAFEADEPVKAVKPERRYSI